MVKNDPWAVGTTLGVLGLGGYLAKKLVDGPKQQLATSSISQSPTSVSASPDDGPTVETWKGARVVVTQPEGFFCKLHLHAKVDLPPDELFEVLTDPKNAGIFRTIKAVPYRKVLSDNGNRQTVEVEQVAGWKFLLFSGTFNTRMYVTQDRRARTIEFKLAKPGLMKNFEGLWKLQPFDPRAMDEAHAAPGTAPPRLPFLKPGTTWPQLPQFGFGQKHSQSSLAILEQSVLPSVVPPPPLDRLLKGISARQVRIIMEDLQIEVERRNQERARAEMARHATTAAAPARTADVFSRYLMK